MKKILKVHRVNDYARYIGAPQLHPLVSVIHYDELEHCRHSLNNYDVFAIFIGDETLEDLTYGLTQYDLHRHALMCVAPGQIGGKADTGEEISPQPAGGRAHCDADGRAAGLPVSSAFHPHVQAVLCHVAQAVPRHPAVRPHLFGKPSASFLRIGNRPAH